MDGLLDRLRRDHPDLAAFIGKVMKDNVGMLASVVAWAVLTSVAPIVVGILAISAIVLQAPDRRTLVAQHLAAALQNVVTYQELNQLLTQTTNHAGLFVLIGFLGVLWGGSNVGGAISTVFQPLFGVRGRDFIPEKLIDVAMIFVLAALMIVILAATTGAALLSRLASRVAPPGAVTFAVGTLVSLLAAFLLFAVIFIVFPNTKPRFTIRHVWPGAALSAFAFTALTYIFPLYSRLSNFGRYGVIIGPILLLTAWIYFFAIVLLLGAEIVSFHSLRAARAQGERLGPEPDGTVPQRASV